MVLNTAVIEDIGTNLRTPLNLLLTRLHLGLLLHTVLQFFVIEHGAQQPQGVLFVLGLVARLGVLNEDFLLLTRIRVFILVAQSNARLHLIYVLSSGTATAESVPRDAGLFDVHLDGIVHKRCNEDAGERGHALTLSVVRRYAY